MFYTEKGSVHPPHEESSDHSVWIYRGCVREAVRAIKFIAQHESGGLLLKHRTRRNSLAPYVLVLESPADTCGRNDDDLPYEQEQEPRQFQRRADYSRGSLECRRRDSQRLYTVSEYNRIRHRDFINKFIPVVRVIKERVKRREKGKILCKERIKKTERVKKL